jgi:hypothetical protein
MMSASENDMKETQNKMVFFQQIDSVKRLIESYEKSYPNTSYNWMTLWRVARLKFLGSQEAAERLYTVYNSVSSYPKLWNALKRKTEEGLLDHISLTWFLDPAFKALIRLASIMSVNDGNHMLEDLINLCVSKILYGKQVCPKKKAFEKICKGFHLRWKLVHRIRDLRENLKHSKVWLVKYPIMYDLDLEEELMAACYHPDLFLGDPNDEYGEPDLRKVAEFFSLKGSNFNKPDGPEYFWIEFNAVINDISTSHQVRIKAEEIKNEPPKPELEIWKKSIWESFVDKTQKNVKDTSSLYRVSSYNSF